MSDQQPDRSDRLRRMNADISRVQVDLRMLDKIADIGQNSRLAKGMFSQLKHSKSSNIIGRKGQSGLGSPMHTETDEERVLPRLRLRKDEICDDSKTRTPNVVKLANFINHGLKMSKDKRSVSYQRFTQDSNDKHLEMLNLRMNLQKNLSGDHDLNQDIYYREFKNASSPLKDAQHRRLISYHQSQGVQFIDSFKDNKPRLINKDAALTSSILNQQNNQRQLNKSIRVSHQVGGETINWSKGYQAEDNQHKQYLREPQTASTDIHSLGGLSNKIDLPGNALVRSLYYSNIDDFVNASKLPSVLKPAQARRDTPRKLSDFSGNNARFDFLTDGQKSPNMRNNGLGRITNQSHLELTSPIKIKHPDAEDIASVGLNIDWSLPASDKLNIKKEFKLDKVLGKGNSSTVYRGFDLRLNMIVAVKIMEKSSMKETYLRDMLQKEIDISIRLTHPHLARLYRVLQDGTKVFIVQEYCGTQTLSQFADQTKISETKAKRIFEQVVSGVNYMHRHGICHRDLKFSNILISDYGLVKLVDFGFACESTKKQRIFCGTPSYMPPELIKKKEYVPFLVDIWSLGVVLYKLLTGNYPFGACNDKDLENRIEFQRYKYNHPLKPEQINLLDNMLRHSPADRMHTDFILKHDWIKN